MLTVEICHMVALLCHVLSFSESESSPLPEARFWYDSLLSSLHYQSHLLSWFFTLRWCFCTCLKKRVFILEFVILFDRSPWSSCSLSLSATLLLFYSSLLNPSCKVSPRKFAGTPMSEMAADSKVNRSEHHIIIIINVMVFVFPFFPFFPFFPRFFSWAWSGTECLAASTQFHSGFDNINLTPWMINVIS